ncbi:MAG: ParA family protein, partial [Tannerellaceae bacterium]
LETTLMAIPLGRETKLLKALKEIENDYDFVVVDCPPSLGLLTINSLVASKYVIAPCETSPLSVYALDDLVDTINAVSEINNELKFMGVIATKFNKVTNSDKSTLRVLEDEYNVLGVIKNSVSAKKGIEEGIPCVIADPNSDVAKEYTAITKRLLEEIRNG